MREKIKKLYENGLKNKKFLQAIWKADNDKKPNPLSSDLEKHLFAGVYYGWLVGEHGRTWELHL